MAASEAAPRLAQFPWRLPSVLLGLREEPRTTLELRMLRAAGAIRNKKRWCAKVADSELLGRWLAEMRAQGVQDDILVWVQAEVTHTATAVGDRGIAPAAVPGTYAADDHVPQHLREALLQCVKALEEGADDYHPGSNGQVLDVVHPSLYPLVYGVSKVLLGNAPLRRDNCLAAMTQGVPAERPAGAAGRAYSARFQWLPAEFEVDRDGHVEVKSYINNLHPGNHAAMYGVIASVFETFVPLFNKVLTEQLSPPPRLVHVDPYGWYDEFNPEAELDEDAQNAAWDAWYETRQPRLPQVPAFAPPPEPAQLVDLHGCKLQVIVKLANIQLTPEKPSYPGGAWHIEGMLNEQIVASGIYYYAQDNVTESQLAFRTSVDNAFHYEQNDNTGVRLIYGLEDEAPLNQVLGAVATPEGRCLCFPNTLQHQVQRFELADKARPGFRKILVFFLVDPGARITSTAQVPPQQLDWWKHEVFTSQETGLAQLPGVVLQAISCHLDSLSDGTGEPLSAPYALRAAHRLREQLMDERRAFVDFQNEEMFEEQFSLCEH